MGRGGIVRDNFMAAALAAIAAGPGTATNGAEFTSLVVEVWDVETIHLQGVVTGGNAANALDVDFNLVASVDGVNYDTIPFATFSITMAGTAVRRYSQALPVIGIHSLKLNTIVNNETVGGQTATAIQLSAGKTYPAKDAF